MTLADPRRRVFPISRGLWLGPFASPERQRLLADHGITHILNVGEAPSVITETTARFREVVWHSIMDLERISDEMALCCLDTLHRMICEPEACVYIHCIAGWNRSPTILWLYLVACGQDAQVARELIVDKAPDAIPGHRRLVDGTLLQLALEHGSRCFLPHPRPDALNE